MKAWVYREYGGPEVVHLETVPTPAPKDDEIVVKVLATTVTAADWRARTLEMPKGFGLIGRLVFGLRRPRKTILGFEFAGEVAQVGRSVTRFCVDDAVFGSTGARMGCHAQFVVVGENEHIAIKPQGLSYEEAAALSFGGATALHFLGKASLQPGEHILIIGASGGVGSATVQLAKHLGAHVTGVTSGPNAEIVRAMGADEVIDYTREDPLHTPEGYDVIVDTVGDTPMSRCRHALRRGGRLLAVAAPLPTFAGAPFISMLGSRKVIVGVAPESRAVAERLAQLATEGVLRPFIDERYEFSQMREAHARVASRRKRGNVVVLVPHDDTP
ncbi:MAG: NAD(P)-dependent alcohol dehydrogenase [Phycisphaeraceae bacterium]|nr:MAG: NAD(P)-dependent alcohol dehydrogenase [Phycisphaeraceae bacterium]